MARFWSVVSQNTSDDGLKAPNDAVLYQDSQCWLGTVPHEAVGRQVGLFKFDDDLIAVGEVTLFNRADLIKSLQEQAPPPTPESSDGDVLLWLYAHQGVDVLAQVEGMFALAIWDGETLLLARDPVGCRTLFYTYAHGAWLATSVLQAIRHWPNYKPHLNFSAVQSFLTFAYLPGKDTLFAGVYELLPGTYLRLYPHNKPDDVKVQTYWEPREQPWSEDTPFEVYQTELRKRLETTVQSQLPSHESVGVFLSGGLDSSLITALAAKLHPNPVQTYAICFEQNLPNELTFSNMVAKHCRTDHQVLRFTGRQIAQGLPEAIALLDCPVGDPLTVPNLLLGRAAAKDGLKVILNGEGGDPCFGGPKNIPLMVYEWHRQNASPLDRAETYLRAYRKAYPYLDQLLSPATRQKLSQAPPLTDLVLPYLESPRMSHYLNKLMYANTRLKGAHHILTKVERLTAACGLEGRSPLFAASVIDYAFAIPPRYKLVGTEEKWILKQVSADLLPQTIITRPKSGMRVPVQTWLQGPLRRLSKEVLLGKQAKARGLFDRATLRKWMRSEGLLWPRHGAMLWLVLSLELWLQLHFD